MKTLFSILFCLPLLALADTTNNITVTFTDAEDTKLRIGWRMDNYNRTNAVPPLSSLTFKQFIEANAPPAIMQRVTSELQSQQEAIILAQYRAASEAKQLAILKEALKPQ